MRKVLFGAACLWLAACGSSEPVMSGGGLAGGNWTVDAGTLKLAVQADPWRMQFFDASGQPVLDEDDATLPLPGGSIGMHLGLPPDGSGLLPLLPPVVKGIPAAPPAREIGWVHATRLIDARYEGGEWIANLATTDPLRTIVLRARRESDGVIAMLAKPSLALGVQAMGVGFESTPGERYVGFGERSNAVSQNGNTLEHYVSEGPYQDIEYPFVTALVPKWGIRWRADTTYFPIPWLLSSRGYGVLLDNDELSYHRLGGSSAWSMEAESTQLKFRVFAGPRPADALRRMTAAIGRQPGSPAPWFFGPWVQGDNDQRVGELRKLDVPTSVAATYTHYLPCGDQQGGEQGQIDRVNEFHRQGVAVHTYFNPMVCTKYTRAYDAAQAQGALIKNPLGQTYTYPYQGSTIFIVSQFDFTAPSAIPFYRTLTDEAIGHGYEGWMEDFGEYTPLDVRMADGSTGTLAHNKYVREYHCGVFEAVSPHVNAGKPLARFVRSGWTGSAKCSPMVWGGDPSTTFGFDGLESSIYQALSIGASGIGLWGSDIGGYFALGFNSLNDEMLDRWIEFGALSVIMRNQHTGFQLPPRERPQLFDDKHVQLWRKYAKLHTQLYPYIRAAVDEYYATGMPVMRHHVLANPDDAGAGARDDQYMFGPDILVAPVYVEGATQRELYLPQGRWIEWWRAVNYNEATGEFSMGTPVVIEGGRSITVDAPLGQIPMFVRAGARIPMLPADTYTLAEYGSDPAIVNLSERAGQERVLEF